jgi:itaconate CoA-transferase
MTATTGSLPLDGVLVVSIEQAVAAPFATRHLADMGARVIKIERPDGGDFARSYDSVVNGMAAHFVWLNRSKESVTLDLKQDEARAVLARLLEDADVFVQNLAPGAAARMGFDAATLMERNPGLTVCDMSGYGSSGPYQSKRAYDLLVQCEAALVSVTGTPEQAVKAGSPVADIAAGLYAYSSILAALVQRAKSGRGLAIEVSMFDAIAEFMGYSIYYTQHTGIAPERAGLSHPSIAPYDAYPTADDRAVVISVQNDREWVRLATHVLHRPELATDPDFATNQARVRNRARVDELVAQTAGQFTQSELIQQLDQHQVASARISSVHDLINHPQLAERDCWQEVDSPAGPLKMLLPVSRMAGVEPRMDPIPALGEHTAAVLAEFGFDESAITAMRSRGAL